MPQKLATLTGIIDLEGKRKESVDRVYELVLKRSTEGKRNPRTGRPYTIYSEYTGVKGFFRRYRASVKFEREKIKGNWPNDMAEIFRNAAHDLNVDVDSNVRDYERVIEVDEPKSSTTTRKRI